jgi:ABC-type transport system involved in cytochrome bd biosynthesis fused ATPase/permease subunit
VSKKNKPLGVSNEISLKLDKALQNEIIELLKTYPLTDSEREILVPKIQSSESIHLVCWFFSFKLLPEFFFKDEKSGSFYHSVFGAQDSSQSEQVFLLPNSRLFDRRHLPIYCQLPEILSTFLANRITVVVGDTGCGKTTQVRKISQQSFENPQI